MINFYPLVSTMTPAYIVLPKTAMIAGYGFAQCSNVPCTPAVGLCIAPSRLDPSRVSTRSRRPRTYPRSPQRSRPKWKNGTAIERAARTEQENKAITISTDTPPDSTHRDRLGRDKAPTSEDTNERLAKINRSTPFSSKPTKQIRAHADLHRAFPWEPH